MILRALLICTLGGCSPEASRPAQPDRLSVVALSAPVGWLVEQIARERVDLVYFTPLGEHPSHYRPSPAQIATLHDVDLIVSSGHGFEAWLSTAVVPASRLVDSAWDIDPILLDGPAHRHGPQGEHSHRGPASYTWLDPDLFLAQAASVERALVARDPAGADVYARGLAGVRSELALVAAPLKALRAELDGRPIAMNDPTFVYLVRAAGGRGVVAYQPAIAPPEPTSIDRLDGTERGSVPRSMLWDAPPSSELLDALPAETDHLWLDPVDVPILGVGYDPIPRLRSNGMALRSVAAARER